MAVENQRVITIRTPKVGKEGKPFVQIEIEDLQEASRKLSAKQVIVYMDLCGNADGFNYEFSPAYYKEHYGMSKDTAQDAFKALEAAGYIVKESSGYVFYRKPQTEENSPEKGIGKIPIGYRENSQRVQENFPQGIGKIPREIDKQINIDNIDNGCAAAVKTAAAQPSTPKVEKYKFTTPKGREGFKF